MSTLDRLKRFDVYRDIPKDLTEQTLSGGIVSLVAMFIMFTLIISEFVSYISITTKHEMFVDAPRDTENEHAMFQINMNITVPAMPCAIVSVDAQDVMGSHVVDVGGKLHKTRTDSAGNIKYINGIPLQGDTTDNPTEQIGEGCNVHGNMIVKMVPGNFHISAHAHANLLHLFIQGTNMNCTHYVHDLTFGQGTELFQNVAGAQGNPLKGTRRVALPDPVDPEISKSYEYYIRVVPTQYQSSAGRIYDSFQYVANSNQMDGKYRLPAIYFRYELSPITVKFTQTRESFSHFIVQLCAIVGGVFTVLGLINNVVSSSLKSWKKKAELNKLG